MLLSMPILADILGGWEVVLILAVALILFATKHLPKFSRGLREGLSEFRKQSDQAAHDAGESLGGIYGKPAAEALTPDNQTAELYDPAVFHREERTNHSTKRIRVRRWLRFWRLIWRSVRAIAP